MHMFQRGEGRVVREEVGEERNGDILFLISVK